MPVTPPPFVTVNNIIQTISVRLEQSNLCHLQLKGYLHGTGTSSASGVVTASLVTLVVPPFALSRSFALVYIVCSFISSPPFFLLLFVVLSFISIPRLLWFLSL